MQPNYRKRFISNAKQRRLCSDLSYNQIGAQLLDDQFVGQASLIDLYLGYNQIETIHEQAFVGLKNLQVLELNNNRLISIHKRAFAPLRFSLQHLNLAHNSHLNQVPSSGLDRLVIFKSHGNPRLRSLPYFRSARSLTFTFAYHCCEYCVSNGRHSTNDDSDNLSARPNGFGPLIWLRDLLAWILSGPEVSDSETPDELDQRPSRVPLSEIIVWPAPPRVVDASSGDSLGTATADKTMIESPTQPKNGPDRSKETATLNRKRRRISQLPVSNLIDELIWEIVATRRVHSVGDERWDDALSSNDHNNHNQSEINMSSVGLKTQEYFNIYLDTHLSAAHESRPKYSEMKISEYISKQMRFKSRDAHGLGPRARRQFEQHIEAQLNPIEGQHLASPVASVYSSSRLQPNTVDCKPQPSPFQPCRDLFDSWPLRFCIWFVFMFAFVGNILVIVVLVSSRQSSSTSALTSIMWLAHSKRHIDVPRFLVINLAVADLLMAVYLGILAIVDLSTLGNFRLYAIKWQYSNGCKLAGFLAVLSSELSVFILAIITLERNYAITNAVHLNRRLSLQKAMIIMIIGYMFAISMALMPLNGISDYGKHSICLPIDFSSSSWARAYVITILTMNTLGFLLLLGCYLRMYCAIRGSQAWNANDLKIAKRMSILVLTDFLCWMPIITVSVASLFGHYLVGIDGVKIMVIFVLPLNSVANPFLYAITTKRFKRDLNSLLSKFWSIMSFHACKSDFELPSNFNQDNFLIACNNNQRDARIGNRKTKSQTDLATKIKSSDLPYLRSHRSRKTAPHTATLNKPTSCGSTKQQVQIRTQDNFVCESIISSKPKIVLDCECHRRSSFDSGDENDIKSLVMPDKTLHSDCESKPMSQILPAEICDIEGRSLLSLVRLGSGAEIHRAHSIRSSIILKSSGSSGTSEILCAKNSKAAPRSSVNYSHHSHNRRRQNLVDDNSQLLLVDHKQHIVDRDNTLANSAASINEIRCKSATQHNRTHKQSCGVKFCSEDPISSKSERNRSPLARRILLSPIARAWSSLQISLSGKKSHSGCSLLQTDPNQTSTVIEEPKEPMLEDSKTHREHHILDDRVMVDEFLLLGATSEQYRGNERRMSRSCETINIQQSPRRVGKAKGASQLVEPTVSTGTTTTTTGSQYEYDDRRILLATINQLARNRERLTNEPELMGNPSRSTRCRSWSPALLGKLEDCISQIRNKLPRLGSSNLKSQHIQRAEMDAISSDESLSSESDVLEKEIVILSSEEEDKFSDNFINMSEHMRLNRNHKNRSLQQQSSITSDSSRITTKSSATFETGTATTNLASSLSELSSNIPLVPGNSRNNYDIYESVRENR